jgi:hypothetical protein
MNQRLAAVLRPRLLVLPVLAFNLAIGCGELPPDTSEEGVDVNEVEGIPEPTETAPLVIVDAVQPDPNTVHITSINASGGSGCPQGSVDATIPPDGLSMSVRFSKFVAERGPNIPPAKSRLNCTLNFGIHVPQGFTVTITQVDNRGSVNIPSGMNAKQESRYRIQGESGEAVPKVTRFKGPAKRNFVASNVFQDGELIFSKCGLETNVNVGTSVVLSGTTTKKGTIAIDGLGQSFTQLYHFGWKLCPN